MTKIKKHTLFLIIGFLLISLLTGCSIVAHRIYMQPFSRVAELSEIQISYLLWHEIDQTKYPREEVHFYSGKNRLQGFIYGGSNDKGLIVISHGMGGTADGYFPMIMFFVDQGWRVFAFNNTGTSGSEGKNLRGFPQSVIDLDAALRFVKTSSALNELPIMLVGHSWGGFAVTTVLNYDHNVNAVVSFSGFNNGRELFREHGIKSAGFFFHLLSPHFWAIERLRFGRAM
ncbi:MAG: lysophospholipase, partial [Bacteroidales bacterium]|nr:lysophospholipase [Bacteroidales bacterium]